MSEKPTEPPQHSRSPSLRASPSLRSSSPLSGGNTSSCSTSDSSPQSGFAAMAFPKKDYRELFHEYEDPELSFRNDQDVPKPTIQFDKTDVGSEAAFSKRICEWLRNNQQLDINFDCCDIENALEEYGQHIETHTKSKTHLPYPTSPRGSLVTKRSRTAIFCINPRTHVLVVGKLRNKQNYSVADGIRQCAAYMYHVLWWFRHVQQLDIKEVVGFCVFGPSCKGHKDNITISFLRLRLPERIGGRMRLGVKHDISPLNSEDMSESLKKLVCFLNMEHFNVSSASEISNKLAVPASLMLPEGFRNGQDGLCIVESGTAALVLRWEQKEATSTVGEIFDVNKYEADRILQTISKWRSDPCVYVKIINPATGKHWNDKMTFLMLLRELCDPNFDLIGDTYATGSFFTHHSHMVFMRDMGQLLAADNLPLFDEFCAEFLVMAKRTVDLYNIFSIVHGDIHRGNILYKKDEERQKRLTLIDWDECSYTKPMVREVVEDHHKERYPDKFLKKGLPFTKVQLLVLYRDLLKRFYGRSMIVKENSIEVHKDTNTDDVLGVEDWTEDAVRQIFESLLKLLEGFQAIDTTCCCR